jgi:hypothetical protein
MAVGCEVVNWTFGVGVAVCFAPSMLRRLLVVLTCCLSGSVCANVEGACAYLFLRQAFALKLISESLHIVLQPS